MQHARRCRILSLGIAASAAIGGLRAKIGVEYTRQVIHRKCMYPVGYLPLVQCAHYLQYQLGRVVAHQRL